MAEIRVIGLGNTLAGDDGVGVLAARRLAGVPDLGAEVVEAERGGLEIIDLVRGSRAVILIDAVRSGRPPGAIHRLDASARSLPRSLCPHSTHGWNAADALELARALEALPPTVIVYGVEAGAAEVGTGLSPTVAAALGVLAERIAGEIAELRHA